MRHAGTLWMTDFSASLTEAEKVITMNDPIDLILVDQIEPLILVLRGQRVMLDLDLARLYGVSTKSLNQAVKRHISRFPIDFMFRLTREEKKKLVTDCDQLSQLRFNKALPRAFSEHGAIMAANILNSPRAIQVGVFVVRAFVKLREFLTSNAELAEKLAELERKVLSHDDSIRTLITSIRQLMVPPPEPPRRRIGFRPGGINESP